MDDYMRLHWNQQQNYKLQFNERITHKNLEVQKIR